MLNILPHVRGLLPSSRADSTKGQLHTPALWERKLPAALKRVNFLCLCIAVIVGLVFWFACFVFKYPYPSRLQEKKKSHIPVPGMTP